jgi:hypothetical protein
MKFTRSIALRATAIGAAVAALGGGAMAWKVSVTPGGLEEVVGDTVSVVRETFPFLTGPIERLELIVQRWSFEKDEWIAGSTTPEALHALPESVVVDVPEVEDTDAAASATSPVPPPAQSSAATQTTVPSSVIPQKNPPAAGPIPGLGPHAVPKVPFDPSILSVPLEWSSYPGAPDWVRVAWPTLNDAFPDDHALVLRFDMSRAAIHWQPGTSNPWPTNGAKQKLADAASPPDRSGRVPMSVRSQAFLAFGGGWESVHFPGYGAMWAGRQVVHLSKGVQTMAIYANGHTALGPWPLPPDGLLEARQNLPPLVHQGKIPSNIVYLNMGSLGTRRSRDEEGKHTFTDVHTWRSALGRLANGDLVYLFADRVTPLQLAATLIRAGAEEAMQLDINAAYHAVPTLFTPSGTKVSAQGLFPGIRNGGTRFLNGSGKDFFYITAKSNAPTPPAAPAAPPTEPAPSPEPPAAPPAAP